MNRPAHPAQQLPEPTIRLSEGWHCLHQYYKVNAGDLRALTAGDRMLGRDELCDILSPSFHGAPERLQVFAVSGDRADFGIMMLDKDPLRLDALTQDIRNSRLGTALHRCYSFVSITEVSEYVPTVEQYAEKLRQLGSKEDDPSYLAKVQAYEQRLPMMNKQRLYPDMPPWPVHCFYPMNKIRHPHANWYQLPFSERSALMAEHATSGIKFAGKVSQLITASTGFDDWEWGVTLWGRSPEYIKEIVYTGDRPHSVTPEYIKEIVYTMRFDQASARYAEFGPFYLGYIMSPEELLKHLRIG